MPLGCSRHRDFIEKRRCQRTVSSDFELLGTAIFSVFPDTDCRQCAALIATRHTCYRHAMIQPQRIGRFLTVDDHGYIQPDVSIDRIDRTWKPLVEFVVRSLMTRSEVLSIYIRGSIPRGLAVENVSDADFIYLSEINFDAADSDLGKAAKAKFPFVKDIELCRLNRGQFEKSHHPKQRPYFHMLLKTQGLLLAGDDVAKDIEPFKVGPDMASHVFSLAKEFSRLPGWLAEDRKNSMERSTHHWFSRRIIRAGFEVTMNRTDRFTRDLYLCYEQFASFYPEQSGQMYQVLVNCLNGEDSPLRYQALVAFLANEGSRLLVS
jgi:hypothetical protein